MALMGTVHEFPVKNMNAPDLPCDVEPCDVGLPLAIRAVNAETFLRSRGLMWVANVLNEMRRKNEESHARELDLLTQISKLRELL